MKKLLLSLSLICAIGANAQDILLTDDFSAYTLGNVGTDITGVTAGQGGWKTLTDTGAGTNTDYQIVDAAGTNGYALQITGSPTVANRRKMFKDLSTVWANRTAGNDITEVEFDFFTGPPTTSTNTMRVILYDPTETKWLGGIMIKMSTLVVSGLCYYENLTTTPTAPIGNYSFGLGASAATPITLSPNTWYRFGFSFDNNTGRVRFRESTGLFNGYVDGAAGFEDVFELAMGSAPISLTSETTNTVGAVGKFDNIVARATSEDTLLLASPTFNTENKFSVYPNPVKDVVTVTNTESIAVKGITVTDLNGRTVKTVNYNNVSENIQVNVADLSAGVYMMNIQSDKGSVTKKIVKN